MKYISFLIILVLWLFSLTVPVKAQDQVKHFNQGEPVLVRTKEFKDYSIKVPDYVEVSVKNERLLLKFVSTPDFAAVLVVKYYEKKAETDLKQLFRRTVEKNWKQLKWKENQIYTFNPEELKKGNAAAGYLLNGYSTDKLPMKIYNTLAVVESADKRKMLLFSGSISVNPGHKNYRDFEEIKRYIYDFKTVMISSVFKETAVEPAK